MIVIDVRTEQEFTEKHTKDSINFSVQEMSKGRFPNYPKDTEIGLYCRSGARSEVARDLMKHNGFTNVVNLGALENL